MSNNQIAVREQQAKTIVKEKMKQISTLVGNDKKKASKFGSALVQLAQNKNLSSCDVESVVDVGFQIVQAGLNPNPLFGQAYVVPFKLKGGFTAAQLQIGYKGQIQLGYRAGWKFRAVPVYKCDEFSYEFGGFEDIISLSPNYDERNEDDGNWVYKNLVGVIVYAKDKDDYNTTEFVSFKKLEKLRLKSQNQIKGKLQYIWLEWAEEMYKAKALKYVITRLPIADDITEVITKEDEVYTLEAPKQKPTNDLNSLVKEDVEAIPVEIEPTPKDLITKELLNKGATQEQAGKWCYGKDDNILNTYLNDPASLDIALDEAKEL